MPFTATGAERPRDTEQHHELTCANMRACASMRTLVTCNAKLLSFGHAVAGPSAGCTYARCSYAVAGSRDISLSWMYSLLLSRAKAALAAALVMAWSVSPAGPFKQILLPADHPLGWW